MVKPGTTTFLVIEDNPSDYFLISDYLSEKFPENTLIHAEKFSEARMILQNYAGTIDVILLDISLPDKTGKELISGIVSLAGGVPVIILTGYSDLRFSISSLSLGASDYLIKDEVSPEILHKVILYSQERNKYTAELLESEKKYNTLFHLNPQFLWLISKSTLAFIQSNEAGCVKLGYSFDALAHTTLDKIVKQEFRNELIQALPEVQGKDSKFTAVFLKKDGEEIYLDCNVSLLNIGNEACYLVNAADVTAEIMVENKITKAIIKTQEDERYEMGAELHDNICQLIASVQMNIGMLKSDISDSNRMYFDHCNQGLRLALTEIRNLSHRLAPSFLNNSTICESIQTLADSFNPDGRYRISFNCSMNLQDGSVSLNQEVAMNLYRIMQEQLRNIHKYANASDIDISFVLVKSRLILSISDNGVGFDSSAAVKGIGLQNMRRRAELFGGKFELITSEGNGCQVLVTLPAEASVVKAVNLAN